MKGSRLQVAALRNEVAGRMPCGFKQRLVQQALSQYSSTLRMCRGVCIHHTHSSIFLQVVALCNELVGRVPCGTRQPVRANLRPVSLTTPAGRLDWDPAGEVSAARLASAASWPHHA